MERVPQPVLQHGVDELDAAHLGAGAQIARRAARAHALHAAGDDDGAFAGADLLRAERDRAQAGAADLVDAEGGLGIGHAGGAGGLAGRVLALAGGEHLAEDHLVHVAGVDARRARSRPAPRRCRARARAACQAHR